MKIFGKKNEAMFDWWSLGHLVLYYVLAKLFLLQFPFFTAIIILICIGYIWEVIERAFENSEHKWFRGFDEKESWANRYIGDILANISGFLLAWFY